MRTFRYIALSVCTLCAVLCTPLSAQEINCSVTVNSDAIEGTNKQVFATLKTAVEEYMNQNRWTNMTYAEHEKIECSMLIVVKSKAEDMFVCDMTLQCRRPVYGATYTTPLINFVDRNFNFVYQEFDRIEYQDL